MTTRRGLKRQRGFGYATVARRAKRRRMMAKRPYTGVELKFADIETTADAFATTWSTMEDATFDSVSGVAQGNGESQRIGRKYAIHSIHIKCVVEQNGLESQTNPINDQTGRICLVWDKQTNGAQLTATDVMDGGQTDDMLAFRNLQHTARFQVLWDRTWKLNMNNQTNEGAANLFANGSVSTPIMKYNKYFNPPIKVICDGTTATIASISDNSLHIIGVATGTNPLLNMQIRIRYTG